MNTSPARPSLSAVWWLLRGLASFIVRVAGAWRVRVVGLEHVPAQGGGVLTFNHHSYFDFVMVAWDVVRRLHRPVRFLAKREIWRAPMAGGVVRLAGAVPVDRDDDRSRQGAFDAAIARLRDGELVAVAPEQTISDSFELLPFRTGAVRMAQGAGVPIIPVVGWGTQRNFPNARVRLRRHLDVFVMYGAPLHIGPDEDPIVATERIREVMAQMLRQVQDEYPVKATPGDDWWAPQRLGGSAPNHEAVLAEHHERFQETRRRREGH